MTFEELQKIVYDAGIVGAGGTLSVSTSARM